MSAPINATPAYARTSSTSSASSGASTPARRGSSFLATVGRKLSEHHNSVNNAYEAYYGAYARPTVATPRSASQASHAYLTAEEPQVKQQSRASKAWQSVKKHAKEHHESVNASYKVLYGAH